MNHTELPKINSVEDGLGQRWGLFLGVSLFYLVAVLTFAIFISLFAYPDVAGAATHTERVIQSIYTTVFRLRWILYLLLATALSPWIVTRAQHLNISQYQSGNESGNSNFRVAFFIFVIALGLLLAYFWQPRYLSFAWGKGISNLSSFYIYRGEASNLLEETIAHLPLVVLMTLLALSLFRVIFGDYPARQSATQETVLASGTLLTAVMLLVLILSQNFSRVWTISALLGLPTTLLFVGTLSWWFKDKIDWYVSVLGFIFLVLAPAIFLFWARNEEYSITWILAIIIALAGILLLITAAVVSRDTTQVKEVIENNLKDPPPIKLPRVNLRLIKQTRGNTAWAMVNLIIDTLSIISITIVNTMARAGHFTINRVIMPSLETIIYIMLWLLTQLFNLLLIFFIHLVFALVTLPDFLRKIATVILEALEINLRFLYFPALALIAAAGSIAISVHLATDYFLTGKAGLIMGTFGAVIVGVFSIVFTLSLLFKVSFYRAFNFYLRSLSELLSYSLLVVVVACWLLVWLTPRFGIEHFKPGLVTWFSTAILLLAIPLAYVFREKEVD